jgi:DNA-binding GntR family transcriptional regulator
MSPTEADHVPGRPDDHALSAVDVCVARLREMIADGVLGAGASLRQEDLATELGMSRTPIREAIVVLQAEGLVVVERNRGAFVANPTPEQLLALYEVRLLLEPHAAGLAARRTTAADLEVLRALYERMEHCAAWEFYRLNREFHLKTYEMAQHPVLYEHIRSLRYRSDPYVRILAGGGGSEAAQHGHNDLLEALADGDADRAEVSTRDHLMSTVTIVTELLEARRSN